MSSDEDTYTVKVSKVGTIASFVISVVATIYLTYTLLIYDEILFFAPGLLLGGVLGIYMGNVLTKSIKKISEDNKITFEPQQQKYLIPGLVFGVIYALSLLIILIIFVEDSQNTNPYSGLIERSLQL